MSEQEFTPVYLITGFLESGKTQLINSMLTDDNFSRGQKTLVICCEEALRNTKRRRTRPLSSSTKRTR